MDRQGNIKDFQGNKIVPNTSSVAVLDVERQQALSASLMALVEKNALGFPDFTTTDDWSAGEKCFYDRRLWNFTSDHAAGDWDANDVEEFSVKEYTDALANEVETVKSEYLKKGTYSADTAVGLADNLRGQTVDSEAYLIRPTGGTENEVANGVASVLGMEGNSCVWNQKINGLFASVGIWSTVGGSYTFANNIATFTIDSNPAGNARMEYADKSFLVRGHKYYISVLLNPQRNTHAAIYTTSWALRYKSIIANQWNHISALSTISTSGTIEFGIYCNDLLELQANDKVLYKNAFCIDLTLLEIDNLTTVVQVEEWLAQHVGTKPYYAYNPGTILSAQTLGIKTYGQNLLNPTTRQAKLIPYTWVENGTIYSNQYTIKNVPNGATATFTPDNTGVAETVDISSGTLDITSYGSGVLELSAATANTYVCIKWNGTKDDDVVPYEDHTQEFDVRKVYGKNSGVEYQCYPNGMRSAGSVHDTLTASEAVVKIDRVDLGTLNNWSYESNIGYFFTQCTFYPIGMSSSQKGGFLCSKYATFTGFWGRANTNDLKNGEIGLFTSGAYTYIIIKDSSIPSTSTPAQIKEALNGVILDYYLKTPITYTDLIYRDGGIDRPLADVLMNITVNNWSMEEQLMTPYEDGNPTSIPATIKTQYGMDVVEAIDTLQKACYFADDVHANLQALLTCINTNCAEKLGGTFAISETATDKVFAFSFTPDVEPTNEGE